MDTDLRLRRATGVIMWAMQHGMSADDAKDKGWSREPTLTASEIDAALEWAKAGVRFALAATVVPPETCIGDLCKRAGLPSPQEDR